MEISKFASLSALFALLTTIAAKVAIPNGDIPFTLQSVFVILSGLVGGPMVGVTSQLIYLLFGLFVPVFAGNQFGFEVMAAPSAGYLFAFPIAALIAGNIGHQQNSIWKVLLACILAQSALYFVGVMVLMINSTYTFQDSMQIGFINLAIIGYSKSLLTGILYFSWQKINSRKNETF